MNPNLYVYFLFTFLIVYDLSLKLSSVCLFNLFQSHLQAITIIYLFILSCLDVPFFSRVVINKCNAKYIGYVVELFD